MNKVVLDASALLALIKYETGATEVEKLLGNIIMSSVNVSEVAAILLDSDMTEEECKNSIEPFISSIIPFDSEQSFLSALLKKHTKHKGLSFGDRACIALGIKLNVSIYTADKAWYNLEINQADIKLIR
ncbi:type II toxin-antitoxin system VapC family toxin [Candidatus Tisiphia endosymbiont of Ditula angustiorana]|uniref:type II toxin-antitoxin system VapC family toxin n=1 Tax=Candidatus Tisiphia endosymbiont of Ditula angustiorana TaxID=3066272 RepID=UPI00312CB92C